MNRAGAGVGFSLLAAVVASVNALPNFISQSNSIPLIVNPADQEGMICGKAMCKFTDNGVANANNYCYKYKFCNKCSVSNVPDHPVCYLLDNDPNYVHLMEGYLGQNGHYSHDGHGGDHDGHGGHHDGHGENSSHYNHDEGMEHDGDSFLQMYESEPKGFVATSNPKDFEQGKRFCMVNAKGDIVVRVRLIIQWYASKDDGSHHHDEEEGHEHEANYLQINSQSMLEMHHDEEDDGEGEKHGSKLKHMATTFHKLKHTGKSATGMFKSPKAKIYLMFSNPKVNTCRSPLIYKGNITPGSMFVATIEPTVPHLDLTPEMIKSSVQVILSCRGCHKMKINSCIQVTCAKNTAMGMGHMMNIPAQVQGFNNLPNHLNMPINNVPMAQHPEMMNNNNLQHGMHPMIGQIGNSLRPKNGDVLAIYSGILLFLALFLNF